MNEVLQATGAPEYCSSALLDFLDAFSAAKDGSGYFFTLNQDLFVERVFNNFGRDRLPRVPFVEDQIERTKDHKLSTDSMLLTVPSGDAIGEWSRARHEPLPGRLAYVKLHGSMNWRSSDGRDVIVIGRYKQMDIRAEPLLKRYWEILEHVLAPKGTRLWVVGYGFRDEHLNSLLRYAVELRELKLFVIDPLEPEQFYTKLKSLPGDTGNYIWSGVIRYFPWSLKDIYPIDAVGPNEFTKEVEAALLA